MTAVQHRKVDLKAVTAAAAKFGFPLAHVRAVVQQESAGIATYHIPGLGWKPAIRFEGHIFYRHLEGKQRDEAVRQGLAHPRAGVVKNPTSQVNRWALLARARKINSAAADEATSWGVGQVMGFHWKTLGYASVSEFVSAVSFGQEGQIEAMLRFIKVAKLDDELIAGEWAPFARGYNGPAYKKNNYDKRLEELAARYGGATVAATPGLLRMGSTGARVRELQALLVRAGYALKVDGDFGPATRDALKGFQRRAGLVVDGVAGPKSFAMLNELRQSSADQPGVQKLFEIDAVKKGSIAAAAAVLTPEAIKVAKDALEGAAAEIVGTGVQSVVLDYLVHGLTVSGALLGVVAAGYAVFGFIQSKKTVEA